MCIITLKYYFLPSYIQLKKTDEKLAKTWFLCFVMSIIEKYTLYYVILTSISRHKFSN